MIDTDIKTLISRPTHFGRKPRTAAALLRQTHKFLAEEGKWIKGTMFKDGDAKRAYERGFCGKWGVCSIGAMGIVSGEFTPGVIKEADDFPSSFLWAGLPLAEYYWQDDYDPQSEIVTQACAYLSLVANPERTFDLLYDGCPPEDSYEWTDVIINWNDASNRTRKQVLDAFAQAAELASKPGSFEAIARKHLVTQGYSEEDFD